MKRIFNKLLVISLVCSILSVLLCIISIGNFDSYTLDAIDEMQSNINTDDVSGYANLNESFFIYVFRCGWNFRIFYICCSYSRFDIVCNCDFAGFC